MPTEEDNCHLVTVTEEEIENSLRVIPRLDTLILIKSMGHRKSFIHPFRANSTSTESNMRSRRKSASVKNSSSKFDANVADDMSDIRSALYVARGRRAGVAQPAHGFALISGLIDRRRSKAMLCSAAWRITTDMLASLSPLLSFLHIFTLSAITASRCGSVYVYTNSAILCKFLKLRLLAYLSAIIALVNGFASLHIALQLITRRSRLAAS